MYLSEEPFSLASQTDRTGPNAEINVDFLWRKEKKVAVEMNEQINILTLTVLLNVDSVN